MEDKDKAVFYKGIKSFLYTLNGTKVPEDLSMEYYWKALKPYTVNQVLATFEQLASTENEHVRPAGVVEKITGKKRLKAKDEFNTLVSLVKKHGVSDARALVDEESKGWKTLKPIGGLAALNSNDLASVRSAFYEAYDKEVRV